MNHFFCFIRLMVLVLVGASAMSAEARAAAPLSSSVHQASKPAVAATGERPHASPLPAQKTFSFRISGEPETLDWNLAHSTVETNILMNLMEGLVEVDAKLQVRPALAASWTVSSDGKVYTFKLKSGVKWSDGVALKASDFVNSWRRLLAPTTAASYAYLLFDIEGAEDFHRGRIKDFSAVGVRATDSSTLQVRLVRPVSHWIYIPTFWVTFPIRQDVVDEHGSAWARPGRMVTLGPYILSAHDSNSRVVMRANPTYHGKKGNVAIVNAVIIKEDSVALARYQAGDLDFLTDISTQDLKKLSKNVELQTFPYLKIGYLGFNVNKYPLNDVKIRRAISMAIDRAQIGGVLSGGQTPATSFVPPVLLRGGEKTGLPYDPLRARLELRQSSWDASRPLKVELLIPNWDKQLVLANWIRDQLRKNLAIQVDVQPFDHQAFRAQLDLNAYPLFDANWGADYPDPDNFLSVFLSNSGNNRTGWKNATYDKLILEARGKKDRAQRDKDYLVALKLLQEEEAVINPLYYEPNKALVKAHARGVVLNPLNYLILREVNIK